MSRAYLSWEPKHLSLPNSVATGASARMPPSETLHHISTYQAACGLRFQTAALYLAINCEHKSMLLAAVPGLCPAPVHPKRSGSAVLACPTEGDSGTGVIEHQKLGVQQAFWRPASSTTLVLSKASPHAHRGAISLSCRLHWLQNFPASHIAISFWNFHQLLIF